MKDTQSQQSKYPILDNIEIRQNVITSWQKKANLLAEIIGVPAALIMRVHTKEIEVFVSSQSDGNVYKAGEKAPLDSGLYCETVMDRQSELLVPNALKDSEWDHNPDVKLGMISYCGLPLIWPTGEVFGTICILDSKENIYSRQYRDLLEEFRDTFQMELALIHQSSKAEKSKQEAINIAVESYENYQKLVETVQAVIYKTTLAEPLKLLYISPQIELLIGYTPTELKSNPDLWLEILHPEDRGRIEQELVPPYDNLDPLELDYRIINQNGEVVWIHDYLSVIEEEDELFVQGVLTDITKQKQIEEALEESELKFRLIYDHASDGILLTDIQTKQYYAANQTLCHMLGYSEQELKKLSIPELHPKESLAYVVEQFEKEATKEFGVVLDIPFQRKDGSVLHTEITGSIIELHGSVYSLAIIRDKTTELKVEAERADYTKRLQQDRDLFSEMSHLRSLYISEQPSEQLFDEALTDILNLTNSQYGYIAQLKVDEDGKQYQQTLAISNIAWDDDTKQFYEQQASIGFRFYGLDALYSATVTSGKPVIANNPSTDSRSSGRLPEGHPSLDSFLGLPLYRGDEIIGSIGIANRPGGYSDDISDYLEPLLDSFVQLIDAYDIEKAREGAERLAQERNEQLLAITTSAQDAIVMMSADGLISYWNPAAEKIFGYSEDEALGRELYQLLDPDDYKDSFMQQVPEFLTSGKGAAIGKTLVLKGKRKDGDIFPLEISLSTVQLKDEWNALALMRDITERKLAEDRIKQASTVFESSHNGIMITDPSNNILAVNHAFMIITGYNERELIGKNANILNSGSHEHPFNQSIGLSLDDDGSWSGEVYSRHKNGEVFPQLLSISSIKNERGDLVKNVAIFTDLTELKRSEYELQHYMNYDPLTGLPNRRLLKEQLERALSRARRRKKVVSVLFLDLDRFNEINESFGMAAGDSLLVEIAKRISKRIRKEDTLARLGSDEFIIVLEDNDETYHILEVAKRILATLEPSFNISGNELFLTASVGISIYPDNADNVEALLSMADTAMYRAKRQGRNVAMFYSDELSQSTFKRLSLEADLRHAIQRNEFVLYYQPQVDFVNGGIAGVEALIRWNHPNRGIVSPGDFIPVAETSDLIDEIGDWVLHESCRQMSVWQHSGIKVPRIAVNLSANQLNQKVVEKVGALLDEYKLPAKTIELEITESTIMTDPVLAGTTLEALNNLELELAIDDFGTGYSSLAYLQRFKVQRLKIDMAFVSGLPDDENQVSLCRAIINMANGLGLQTVAEGVETTEQRGFLINEGCHIGQGYLFSKPLPANELEEVIQLLNSESFS